MKIFIRYLTIFCVAYVIILSVSIVKAQSKRSEWTIETLKEYFERRLTDLQIAVNKAEEFAKEKFENTNEWRATLENLGRTYMPRLEQESRDKSQDERIQSNADAIKKIEAMKQGGSLVWAYIIGGFGMVFGIISLMINLQKKVIK